MISLYLRAQGHYVVYRDTGGGATHIMNRGLFFWVGTRELLPAAWRWFAACVQHGRAQGEDEIIFLAQSALMRITRALQVRDAVHLSLNRPQDNDIADDALSSLDIVLLLLMGSVDATARVAHRVLALPGSPRRAAWHRTGDWLTEATEAARELRPVMGDGTDGHHALTILSLLRNSVHGEALQPLAVRQNHDPQRTVLGIPRADAPSLLQAFAALGGKDVWGIEEFIPGRFHADPGIFLETLIPRILAVSNAVMTATPVERLAGVDLRPDNAGPPADGTFEERFRLSIRWQLGL